VGLADFAAHVIARPNRIPRFESRGRVEALPLVKQVHSSVTSDGAVGEKLDHMPELVGNCTQEIPIRPIRLDVYAKESVRTGGADANQARTRAATARARFDVHDAVAHLDLLDDRAERR
jgi:hypothetical protein